MSDDDDCNAVIGYFLSTMTKVRLTLTTTTKDFYHAALNARRSSEDKAVCLSVRLSNV